VAITTSTLRGGPADKAGIIHEALWGVYGIVQVLAGEANCIRIEEPGTDGAEFYLDRSGIHEHWQAKRQLISQKTWSLHSLQVEGVLGFFQDKIKGGERCVFASITDAPELRGLSENSRAAKDSEEFQSKFIASKNWRTNFEELGKLLGHKSPVETFEFLRQIQVEGARESTLESLLMPIMKAWFTGAPQTVLSLMRDLYITSVHQTLTADAIISHLKSHGINRRSVAAVAGVRDFLAGITSTYIAGQRAKLIRGENISRRAAAELAMRIAQSEISIDALIVGPAGSGKSAGLLEIVEALRAAGIAALAFRLDRIKPVASTEALGKELGLPESPAVVLSQVVENQPIALVVDQLDFVSSTSGRHPDFFEVVAALAEEVRGLRTSRKFHMIMACREFDFKNDNRIQRLLPPNQNPVSIGLLTDAEVKNVIAAEHGDPSRLSAKQLELLCLPQNLSMFIAAGLAREEAPGFVTQKGLLDTYWISKRKAVAQRCSKNSAEWNGIIERLTDEMSGRQELSVSKARLDEFSPDVVAAMVSEDVLTFQNQRYGFGHESLFDYCFARKVSAAAIEFVEFLEKDDQQVFRRAQLRQVLVFLRDDDFSRYLRNVRHVLASPKIRAHLKLLTLELLAAFPDPRDEEFAILLPYLEAELECRRKKVANPNKISSRAIDSFFASPPLFVAADRAEVIKKWLHSGEQRVEDFMTFYLRRQAIDHADRVAELLEPFAGKEGAWKDRLRYIMSWGNLEKGRRFFELFLKLLDNGTLDAAKGPIAINSTFWSILTNFAKHQPAWCAEVAAHWLERKVSIIKASTDPEKSIVSLDDQFGVDDISESARGAPNEFLRHVLPSIIHSADALKYPVDEGFARDRIWHSRYRSDYIDMEEAYLSACETSFELVANSGAEGLRPYITLLRDQKLYIANYLLLNAYLRAPETLAEEAATLLAAEPARLVCGFGDSPFWITRCLLEKCSVRCTDETFRKLEAVILEFSTPYERSKDGLRRRGYTAYTLASALAPARRAQSTNRRIREWERKFGSPEGSPRGIRVFDVVSPIERKSAEHMSDEQWLKAIEKHNTERTFDWENPGRGGAQQLAGMLQDFVKKEPERFARLSLKFSKSTEPSYFMNVLYGLKEAAIDPDLKLSVARRVFDSTDAAILMAALDLLASIEKPVIPDDSVQFVKRMATEYPDPQPGAAEKDDLLFAGINSTRGHAVQAIRDLLFHDKAYLAIFGKTIEQCVRDQSLAVRACVVTTLSAVAYHDTKLAIALFNQLIDAGEQLLTTHDTEDFLARGLREHIQEFRPHIERMLKSENDEVRQAGARLACLARLYHPGANDLAEAAIRGDPVSRLGAAEIASRNLTHPDCREWCDQTLRKFFNDENDKVREKAAGSFWHLWQQPELPLTEFNSLISAFLGSQSFTEEPTYILHALDDSRQRVPETILDVCHQFIEKCAEQARDIRTSMSADESTVGKLVFRAYAQLEAQPLRIRALDLIDKMCEEGLQSAGKQLKEFER